MHMGPGFFAAALVAVLAAEPGRAQTLTVVNQGGAPGEAQRVAVFEPFSKETGIKIAVDTYNQELAKIRAQIETKNLVWDVASLNPINEAAGCEEGLLEKIDWAQHIDPKPFAPIGGFGQCGAPYLVSPGALVYDADKLKGDMAPQSWADFWDLKKWPGKRGLLYQPDQVLEVALIADGVAPPDVPKVLAGPGGVDRAFRKLGEIKSHVKWWKSGDESMQLILTGEVDMVYAWQGRVNIASRTNRRNLKIVWPAGYVNALIYLGVMKGTPRKEEAIKLVTYQLSAEAQARFAEIMGYPPANADAYKLLSEAKRADLPSQYVDRGMMQAGSLYINFWLDNGDAIRQRFATFVAQYAMTSELVLPLPSASAHGAVADDLSRQVRRAERRHRLLMLALMGPSVVFVALFFVLPIGLFLFRSIDNPEIPRHLPRTAAAIGAWDGRDLPDEPVYAAFVEDLRALKDSPNAALLGRRLNYAVPGYRGLLTRTIRRLPDPDGRAMKPALVGLDPKWGETATWAVLRQQSGRLTSFYLLTALDLERASDGSIRQVSTEQAIFLDLYGRTLLVSVGVTLLCLVIGYPVAAVMAQAKPATANWLLMLVLVPFWTSLLVRTTAWVILLQSEGVVNKALIAAGLVERPLSLVFNRTGVFIAMVHVLLPYMILPIYSVMKGVSGSHLRAASSLGASPVRVFRTVFLPLTMPGVAAGCTLVFVLAVGFYVTPALVGGPGDQMIGYFIAYFTNSAVNWGLASALGALLLLLVAAIYLALGRLVGFDKLKVR